jgi:ATP adenylyltransferase
MNTKSCPFCTKQGELLFHNETAFAMLDRFPVTRGHTLIIPKRHSESIFDLDHVEWIACIDLLKVARQRILTEEPSVTGFNIGINVGIDAGQTIDHAHIHIIPRRARDVENPLGGVRNIISGKGDYFQIPQQSSEKIGVKPANKTNTT